MNYNFLTVLLNNILLFNKMKFYQKKEFIINFINLMEECHKIILNIYDNNISVEYKGDNSPLTEADKKCNINICNYLEKLNKELNMDILIISEENKNLDYEERKKYEWVWLVDPLDGTKEFIKQNGQFTVNIGLCYNGEPVFGIVGTPVGGDIYYGIKGIGSFKYGGGILSEIRVNKKSLEDENLKIVASSSHLNEETKEFIKKYKNPELINVGSSIKLLWIAEGRADIYPRIAPTMEWDTCASHAVVKYAGGKVLIYKSKDELKYNKENLLNDYFVCL